MDFKLGELFCGPGGMGLGATESSILVNGIKFSITHCWANDYDESSCETYRSNISRVHPESVIHCDVKKLDINSLEKIDAFAYGFPCNDFSLVGEQKGLNGKFGGLYTYGIQVINKMNPKFIVAENVGGLSSSNEGKAFRMICNELEASGDHGYELTVHKYKAEEYGIAQKRHRIIMVGIRKDLKLKFHVPKPTTKDAHVSVKEALENPPILSTDFNHEFTKQSKTVIERLSHIKPGQNVWNADLPEHLKLNVKGAKLSQIYRRLNADQPSYTITGSGGGGTHGYHYKELRALTNRERARIQSFPDNFIFQGSKENVRKTNRNGCPPCIGKDHIYGHT